MVVHVRAVGKFIQLANTRKRFLHEGIIPSICVLNSHGRMDNQRRDSSQQNKTNIWRDWEFIHNDVQKSRSPGERRDGAWGKTALKGKVPVIEFL
jgi:hypothetical protein